MKSGICPKCGSREVYVHEMNLSFALPQFFLPITRWRRAPIRCHVCTICGYLEQYVVGTEFLTRIRKNWRRGLG